MFIPLFSGESNGIIQRQWTGLTCPTMNRYEDAATANQKQAAAKA
jgi:hypothetical protein